MKTSEIVEGGTYGNGKMRVRRVMKLHSPGPQNAVSQEWLIYEIVEGRRPWYKPEGNIEVTLQSFASWAKERIA